MAMNTAMRLKSVEIEFNTKQAERDEHIKQADLCLEEMHKLQGEFRLLTELEKESTPDAATVDVTPEEAE